MNKVLLLTILACLVIILGACTTEIDLLVDPEENRASVTLDIKYQSFYFQYISELETIVGTILDEERITEDLAKDPRFFTPEVRIDEQGMEIQLDVYPFFESADAYPDIIVERSNELTMLISLHSELIGFILSEIPSLSLVGQGFLPEDGTSSYALRESIYWAMEEYAARSVIGESLDISDVRIEISNSNGVVRAYENDLQTREGQTLEFGFNPFVPERSKKTVVLTFLP